MTIEGVNDTSNEWTKITLDRQERTIKLRYLNDSKLVCFFAISSEPAFNEKTEVKCSQGAQLDIQNWIGLPAIYIKYPLEDQYFFLTLLAEDFSTGIVGYQPLISDEK